MPSARAGNAHEPRRGRGDLEVQDTRHMCGIAGIVRFDGLAPDDRPLVSALAAHLWHRGPDGDGFYFGSHAAIASRRLAIIDEAGGAQPLFNEDRTIALVCNGEIYNHVEL